MTLWQVIERLPDGREREIGEPADLATATETYRTRVLWAGSIKQLTPNER